MRIARFLKRKRRQWRDDVLIRVIFRLNVAPTIREDGGGFCGGRGEKGGSVEGDGESEGVGDAQERGDGGVALSVLDIADGGGAYVDLLGEFREGDAEGLAAGLDGCDDFLVCHRFEVFVSLVKIFEDF